MTSSLLEHSISHPPKEWVVLIKTQVLIKWMDGLLANLKKWRCAGVKFKLFQGRVKG